eukprot:GAHX01001859.1.p1 GENE.GAHX01001859.1~~GAHX01001859.1.p1  ORF type:complete len:380 (-),score=58.77 GAHX01001859.1:79-1218(-)
MSLKTKKLPHKAPKYGFNHTKHKIILIIGLTATVTLIIAFLIIVIAISTNTHNKTKNIRTSPVIHFENISHETKAQGLIFRVNNDDIPNELYNLNDEETNLLKFRISDETFDSILLQIEPISSQIKVLLDDYKQKLKPMTNYGEDYTMNTHESLARVFGEFFIEFNLVVKNTLECTHNINELTKTVQLTDYQIQMIRLIVTTNVIRLYLKARTILGFQTKLFLRQVYSSLGTNTIGNPKFNKANVVIRKTFAYVFEDVLKTNDSELFRTIANYKHELWIVRNIEYIPYYLAGESFNDILLTFELDKNGEVLSTLQWINTIYFRYHETENIDEYMMLIQKLENKCKVLVEMWITESSEYNLDKIVNAYKDYVKIFNTFGK